jgi:hypothetical protein
MRDITLCPLVFSVILAVVACVPAVPSIDKLSPGAPDAAPTPGSEDPPFTPMGEAPAAGRGGSAGGTPHADAGAAPARVDARVADGGDTRPASADARAEGGLPAASDAGHVSDLAEVRTARPPHAGEVVITELLVDPVGNDLGHEWIEVANLADEPVDLGALHLTDGTSEVAAAAGVLAAGGLLVLGQSVDRAHNGDAPVDVAYGTKLALNNGDDRIALCAGPCADGITLDAFAWTTAWGDVYVGHAVVVERGTGSTCPATESYGSGGNFGTPGQANPPCPAPRPEPAPEPPRDGG